MAMASIHTEYLLLEDVEVPPTTRRLFRSTTLPRLSANLKVKIVPRGALISLGDGDGFKVEKSSANEIQSENLSISGGISKDKIIALSDREHRMLRAVPDDARRYEVFLSGRLKWACELKQGDNVLVKISKLPTSVSPTGYATVNAVLRWSGNPRHDSVFQTWKFGVEIMVSLNTLYNYSQHTPGPLIINVI